MNTMVLSPYVSCGFRRDGSFSFGFGSLQQIFWDHDFIAALLRVAAFCKTPRTLEEIRISCLDKQATKAADFLIETPGFLIETRYRDSEDRYSRQSLYWNLNGVDPDEARSSLRKARVVVLGCGGIGNLVACNLATAGVGQLTLVDSDLVEESNLTRQFMFSEKDIGKSKVEILQSSLTERNSEINIDVLDLTVRREKDLKCLPEHDLLILSADSPSDIISWVNNYAVSTKTAFINVGYVVDVAVVGPFVIPGETACMSCQSLFADKISPELENIQNISKVNAGFRAPSMGPINMISAGLASLECMKYLVGIDDLASKNRRWGYWTSSNQIETQDCMKNPRCDLCA